ncbi:hypothetical protein [Sphingobacterium sp. ML3W]|uniref:hypothetical protein n=1 Tax=Sphingobacterium sp. ML3W TaxID=1538644 RepID=UPI000A751BA8|nr:hypothetical protein [Sphingobacterium sp. ML3W]
MDKHMNGCENCCATCGRLMTEEQTQTNTTIAVPVAALSDFELAKEAGAIPEDMTFDEWLNRPVNVANGIFEFGDNA